jgi:hypothetical protein
VVSEYMYPSNLLITWSFQYPYRYLAPALLVRYGMRGVDLVQVIQGQSHAETDSVDFRERP